MRALAVMLAAAGMSVLASAPAPATDDADDAAAAAAMRALAGRGGGSASGGAAPLTLYPEVLERPLFSPTRRPAPATTGLAAPAVTPDLPTLRGVMLAKGRRVALLDTGDASNPSRVTEGTRIGAWTVERIEADRIVLRAADGTTTPVFLWSADGRL